MFWKVVATNENAPNVELAKVSRGSLAPVGPLGDFGIELSSILGTDPIGRLQSTGKIS